MHTNLQELFPVAVVIPTTLRPMLLKAVRSVFKQSFPGRIQILIGIDVRHGDPKLLDQIKAECPDRMAITVIDLGYSTSVRHGGTHTNCYSGAIRTILSYAANSRYVAYLDDDDWWDSSHLSKMLEAVQGKAWAFSLRWFADKDTELPICVDEWDSVGPGKGINNPRFGGFVAPSNLILDKLACDDVLPMWARAAFKDGTGEDRLVFQKLKEKPHGETRSATTYYAIPQAVQLHEHHLKEFKARGIEWIYDRSKIPAVLRG